MRGSFWLKMEDSFEVVLCFGKEVTLPTCAVFLDKGFDVRGACVIRGECFRYIAPKFFELLAEVLETAPNVLVGVGGIYAEGFCRIRHELKQPQRPLRTDCVRVHTALRVGDFMGQVHRHPVVFRRLRNPLFSELGNVLLLEVGLLVGGECCECRVSGDLIPGEGSVTHGCVVVLRRIQSPAGVGDEAADCGVKARDGRVSLRREGEGRVGGCGS